jgi:hypothetical protein
LVTICSELRLPTNYWKRYGGECQPVKNDRRLVNPILGHLFPALFKINQHDPEALGIALDPLDIV